MRWRTFLAGMIGLAVLVTVGLVGSNPASATSGTMTILVDTVLSEDHTGDIIIGADGVTLDCDGHTVTGAGAGIGISLDGRTGVTVTDCDVTNFSWGINLNFSSGNTLNANVARLNSQAGISLDTSNNNTLESNQADDNGFGMHATFGFSLLDSDGNVLTSNSASGNGETGFSLQETASSSDGNTLSNNTASGGDRGFAFASSDGNTFHANTVIGVSVHGFESDDFADNNTLTDNTVTDSGGTGFRLGGTGNMITGNESHRNGGHGFNDFSVPGVNNYSDNSCLRNGFGGSDPAGLCNPSGTFTDDDGSVFEFDIEWIAGEGITKGCNPPANDRYCPDDFVTRGQMAAFLVRALGYIDNGGGDLFVDDDGHTFEGDIDKLGTAGVTKGCNPPVNDRYCPNDLVTRGAMAAFLVRALSYVDSGGGDLFVDDDGHTFENDIDKLATAGVTKGCNPPTNDRYCPDDFVTRGQMAAFLHRALGT